MEKFTQAPVGLDIDQTVSSNSTAITNINNKFLRNINNVSDTQLDALTTAGVYYGWIENGSTCPAKGQWSFIVVNAPSTGYCSQVVISAQTSATLASRYLSNGTWTAWTELAKKSGLDVIGESYTYTFAGGDKSYSASSVICSVSVPAGRYLAMFTPGYTLTAGVIGISATGNRTSYLTLTSGWAGSLSTVVTLSQSGVIDLYAVNAVSWQNNHSDFYVIRLK